MSATDDSAEDADVPPDTGAIPDPRQHELTL
jgi:hypothetical protein